MGDGLFVRCTVVQRLTSMRDSQWVTTTIGQCNRSCDTTSCIFYRVSDSCTRPSKVVLKRSNLFLPCLRYTQGILVPNPIKVELDIFRVVLKQVWVRSLNLVFEVIHHKGNVLVLSNLLHVRDIKANEEVVLWVPILVKTVPLKCLSR